MGDIISTANRYPNKEPVVKTVGQTIFFYDTPTQRNVAFTIKSIDFSRIGKEVEIVRFLSSSSNASETKFVSADNARTVMIHLGPLESMGA